MWIQVVFVTIVAVVFLSRLVFALYDRPSRSGMAAPRRLGPATVFDDSLRKLRSNPDG